MDECFCDLPQNSVRQIELTMRKKISLVDPNDKEDLQQELYMKIIEKLENTEFYREPPEFWSFFEKE